MTLKVIKIEYETNSNEIQIKGINIRENKYIPL